MDYSVHVCFATGQADANLLPVLQQPKQKLEKVIMLATPSMAKNAQWFKEALLNKVSVEVVPLQSDLDINEIYDVLLNILPEYEGKVIVNITGGTKLMAVSTYSVCASLGVPFFYSDLQSFKQYYFEEFPLKLERPHSVETIGQEIMETRSYLDIFLRARGFQPSNIQEWNAFSSQEKDYADFIMKQRRHDCKEKLMAGIKLLNKAAAEAYDSQSSPEAPIELTDEVNWFLDEITKYNWVKYEKKPYAKTGKLKFANKEISGFLAGRWFEQYCAQVIRELGLNIKIFHGEVDKEGRRNELDVIFLYKGKIHLIEVKTANLKNNQKGQDVLHKLNSLRQDLGGFSAKACLISLEKITASTKKRAEGYKIKCIEGVAGGEDRIKQLLKEWIAK